jgi:hypothetical protein
VTGCVDDGEVILLGVKPAVRDVDRDAALALLLEVVHHPGELERRFPLRLGFGAELIDLFLSDDAGVEQQPSNGRRLAVVNVPDEDDVEVGLLCHCVGLRARPKGTPI